MIVLRYGVLAGALMLVVSASLFAADLPPTESKSKAGSLVEEPEAALRKLTALGLKVDLFAAEPDVRNPVALSIDEYGRVFVVESDRRRSSVFDIRSHREWLEADFSFRTVAARAEFLREQASPKPPWAMPRLTNGSSLNLPDFNRDGIIDWHDLEVQSERIRLLEDTNGDVRVDRAVVFADGFTNLVAGVAAGVLAQRGEVYFACIPDLWRIPVPSFWPDNPTSATPATPDAAIADCKSNIVNLLTGFGVHIAFGGHDMHGLIFGPDGKLYWSIADRGTDTNLFARLRRPPPGLTPEILADSGCVFRATPYGSELEVIAWGLRNPQELAFDEFGNLFTADNNGDGGDKARWHHIVEGADFGWRMGWQWLEARAYQPKMGPWNGERLWHLGESNTAAWLLPPLAHIGHGPAGLVYNPGTGLPAAFDRHFFLCDFPGHVLTWTNIPDGASFRAGPVRNFFGELGPTDIAFHPDGGVLVTDWFKTFEKTDKGRIYRVHDPATDASPIVKETRRLLGEALPVEVSMERTIWKHLSSPGSSAGPANVSGRRDESALRPLLAHRDARVRQIAEDELIDWQIRIGLSGSRGEESPLIAEARSGTNLLARMHAIRGLERIERAFVELRPPKSNQPFLNLLNDPHPEIRVHAARALSAINATNTVERLIQLLADSAPRVRLEAALALGKLRRVEAFPGLVRLLADNADRDPYLRHAAVLALAQIGETKQILEAAFGPNAATQPKPVRLGLLLALRRLAHPAVARFLHDADPQLVLESARAINDVPIDAAMPDLAAILSALVANPSSMDSELRQFTFRRALNANFRLGHATNAHALAAVAAASALPAPLRVEALELLALWASPPGRDHFMGLWRPLPARPAAPAADALRPLIDRLFRDSAASVQLAAVRTAAALRVGDAEIVGAFADATQSVDLRVEALRILAERNDARLAEALTQALADPNERIRAEATRRQTGRFDLARLERTFATGTVVEQQASLAGLVIPATNGQRAQISTLLSRQMERLLSGTLPRELAFDVLDAATANSSPAVRQQLTRYTNSLPKADALAPWRSLLHGGNVSAGRATFYDNQLIACFRCHKLNGEGGEVGPDLTPVAAQHGREYLLESILFPNKVIAAGYESATVTLKSGTEYNGVIKTESALELTLFTPEDGLVTVKKAEIADRRKGLSAMPEELVTILAPRELRDLLEFLATAK